MIRRLSALIITTVLVSSSLQAQEQTPEPAPWYEVEILLFSQPGDALNDEHWDTRVFPSLTENHMDAELPETVEGLIKPAENEDFSLPASIASMKARGYQMLYHGKWQQAMLPREQSRPIRIKAGELISDGYHQLDGEIELDIARYLHLRTHLFYSVPVSAEWMQAHKITEEVQSTFSSEAESNNEISDFLAQLTPVQQAPQWLTVKMEQGRRMRGGELHYIDHPFFGMLIRMTRMKEPAAESELELPIPVPAPVVDMMEPN